MSAQQLLKDFRGLVTATGILARPSAAASVLENFFVDGPGVIRKRRGLQGFTAVTLPSPVARLAESLTQKQNDVDSKFYAVTEDTLSADGSTGSASIYLGVPTSGWNIQPTVDARSLQPFPRQLGISVTPARAYGHAEMNTSSYFSGLARGVRRVDADSTLVEYSGMPRGQAPDTYNMVGAAGGAYDVLTGAPGTLLQAGWARAYRVTWHARTGDNAVELGGAPTARIVIRNATGTSGFVAATTKDVALRIRIPRIHGSEDEYSGGSAGTLVGTNYYVRVWATRTWNTATDTGDDECYLQTEQFVTGADLAAGYLTITDNTPDGFLQGSNKLHTNTIDYPASEAGLAQGQLNADEAPPIAGVIASWRNVMWYAAATVRPQVLLKQLSLPANNATYSDGVVTITAKNAPAAATDFQIVSGLGSVSLNIEMTARNFCEVYNRQANAWGHAFYVSLGNQMPGLILVEQRGVRFSSTGVPQVVAFTLTNTNALQRQIAGQMVPRNTLFFSKPLRPDAVPPVNTLTVGSSSSRILALRPVRDRLLVFTSEGIFQVTGSNWSNFSVVEFDTTLHLVAPGSVEAYGDTVFAWCREGIAEIDSTGARIISLPITPTVDDILREILATAPASGSLDLSASYLGLMAFTVVDSRSGRVKFFYPENLATVGGVLPAAPLNPGCVQSLVWNVASRTWATESYGAADNDLRLSDGQYGLTEGRGYYVSRFGQLGSTWAWREKAGYVAGDYADDGIVDVWPVISVFAPVIQLPDLLLSENWLQLYALFEDGELSWRARPSAVQVRFTDARRPTPAEGPGGGLVDVFPTVSEGRVRVEVPDFFRRANRQSLAIIHSTSEYCGIYGVALETADVTRTGVRT